MVIVTVRTELKLITDDVINTNTPFNLHWIGQYYHYIPWKFE